MVEKESSPHWGFCRQVTVSRDRGAEAPGCRDRVCEPLLLVQAPYTDCRI